MTFTGNERLRGEFDSVDLIAGILITLAIPFLAFFLMRSAGVETKGPSPRERKAASKEVVAKPDAELIAIQLEYFEKIYSENGKEFMRRSQQSRGVQRLNEKDWASQCFKDLINQLSSLENELKGDEILQARYASQVNSIKALKARIQLDRDSFKPTGGTPGSSAFASAPVVPDFRPGITFGEAVFRRPVRGMAAFRRPASPARLRSYRRVSRSGRRSRGR